MAFYQALFAAFLLNVIRRPYILTLHGGGLPAFAHSHSGRVHWLLSRAKIITTPSNHIKNELNQFRDDILVLPNGIDIKRYPFRLRDTVTPRVCWLRAFHQVYNPLLAVRTIKLLKQKYPKIQLTMIGPDKMDGTRREVLRWIDQHNLLPNIRLEGGIPKHQVPTRLGEHDIFLNTTRFESFGVAVMEAAAIGLPIVTTNVGELPLLWTHNHDALLVPQESPVEMAQAIERLITSPALAARLAQNARKKAEAYDWSVVLPQWEQIFQQALAG